MNSVRSMLLGLAVVFALVVGIRADDEEKTLKGSITCAKCDLKKADKCATVIVVKDGDKEIVYYFDEKGHKDNHKAICTDPKKGSVKGKVSEKDGKQIVTVSKVEFDKE